MIRIYFMSILFYICSMKLAEIRWRKLSKNSSNIKHTEEERDDGKKMFFYFAITPILNIIIGFIALLLASGQLDEEAKRFLEENNN